MAKAPQRKKLDIDRFVETIAENYLSWNPPIITLVANKGATPFEVLVSTILSLRTKDEVTSEATVRLFKVARTPEEILATDIEAIKKLIYPVGFYPTKAKNLHKISRIILEEYDGKVPDDMD